MLQRRRLQPAFFNSIPNHRNSWEPESTVMTTGKAVYKARQVLEKTIQLS